MSALYNFSAGPAMLPTAVLKQAQSEMLDYQGTGMDIMSMSHRSETFMAIAENAETDFRTLLSIPDNYKVLFLQGGATTQFALLPFNLAGPAQTADYVNTGIWAKKAISHASSLVKVNIAASAESNHFHSIPASQDWHISHSPAYLHYTDNETIGGLEFDCYPTIADSIPLVSDMSSSILSKSIDISRFGVIYAGAQKNIGPSGLTIVIIREDLLERAGSELSPILSYQQHAQAGSMLNTPPTYSWYIAGLVFQWLKNLGGVDAISKLNAEKASLLYDAIDQSALYHNPIEQKNRSRMNIPFTLANTELEPIFLDQANKHRLVNLEGHRSVGGMRASIYNAMPIEGVKTLIDFMQQFERQYI